MTARAAPLPPETKYVDGGGARIAYQVTGEGPVDVVFVPGWLSHMGLIWENPAAGAFLRTLASFSRLILFDKRGSGLSERRDPDAPLDVRVDDMRRVLDALGSRSAVFMGSSEGGLPCMFLSATHPELVKGLVLHATFPGALSAPDFAPAAVHRPIVDALERCVQSAWGTGDTMKLFAPGLAGSARLRQEFGRFEEAASSPPDALRGLRWARQLDLRPIIPGIQTPTLVIHRAKDCAVPVEGSRWIAEHLPGARYLELPGDDHLFFLGGAAAMLGEVRKFIEGLDRDRAAPASRFAAVVAIWADGASPGALAPLADVLERAGCELSTRGGERHDCIHGITDAPSRAIRACVAVRDRARALGVGARFGVHLGPIFHADDSQRATVAIATSVAEAAAPLEVRVTKTLADVLPGSGVRLASVASSDTFVVCD